MELLAKMDVVKMNNLIRISSQDFEFCQHRGRQIEINDECDWCQERTAERKCNQCGFTVCARCFQDDICPNCGGRFENIKSDSKPVLVRGYSAPGKPLKPLCPHAFQGDTTKGHLRKPGQNNGFINMRRLCPPLISGVIL